MGSHACKQPLLHGNSRLGIVPLPHGCLAKHWGVGVADDFYEVTGEGPKTKNTCIVGPHGVVDQYPSAHPSNAAHRTASRTRGQRRAELGASSGLLCRRTIVPAAGRLGRLVQTLLHEMMLT